MEKNNQVIQDDQSDGISTNDSKNKTNLKKELFDWVKVIIIALAFAFLLNRYVIVTAQVPTGSMENTIMTDDRIMAYRLAYLFSEPKRGDIVVFKYPDDETQDYIKRVIGLPGDTVEIIDGKVYINNSEEPLTEDYVREIPEGSYGPYEVPVDCYFMLGDNRNVSEDSRFWLNTFVHKDKILGKAIIDYFPSPHLLN